MSQNLCDGCVCVCVDEVFIVTVFSVIKVMTKHLYLIYY